MTDVEFSSLIRADNPRNGSKVQYPFFLRKFHPDGSTMKSVRFLIFLTILLIDQLFSPRLEPMVTYSSGLRTNHTEATQPSLFNKFYSETNKSVRFHFSESSQRNLWSAHASSFLFLVTIATYCICTHSLIKHFVCDAFVMVTHCLLC